MKSRHPYAVAYNFSLIKSLVSLTRLYQERIIYMIYNKNISDCNSNHEGWRPRGVQQMS